MCAPRRRDCNDGHRPSAFGCSTAALLSVSRGQPYVLELQWRMCSSCFSGEHLPTHARTRHFFGDPNFTLHKHLMSPWLRRLRRASQHMRTHNIHTCTPSHIHAHSQKHRNAHAHTRTHTHAHTHAHTHTLTRTHNHTRTNMCECVSTPTLSQPCAIRKRTHRSRPAAVGPSSSRCGLFVYRSPCNCARATVRPRYLWRRDHVPRLADTRTMLRTIVRYSGRDRLSAVLCACAQRLCS